MKVYEDKGIKDIIAEFPAVEAILEEYGIGCGPCTVGICQLKDILDIHRMEPEKETELMSRVEGVIYPERNVTPAAPVKTPEAEKSTHTFSAPMQILVEEHVVIKRWLAVIPSVVDTLDLKTEEGQNVAQKGINLIQFYADKLHHGKEEDVLFTYFDDTERIFQVIYEDHRIARNHVTEMLAAFERRDTKTVCEHLMDYARLLTEHIKKEDGILFPWLDTRLTGDQVTELVQKFDRVDRDIGVDLKVYHAYLDRLENRFGV